MALSYSVVLKYILLACKAQVASLAQQGQGHSLEAAGRWVVPPGPLPRTMMHSDILMMSP